MCMLSAWDGAGRVWAIREQGPTSLHASPMAPCLKPAKEGGGMREKSPTIKGFASLQGCVFFCKDKFCWVIKNTQTHRLRPGDKKSSIRMAVPLPLSLSLFFFFFPQLGFFKLRSDCSNRAETGSRRRMYSQKMERLKNRRRWGWGGYSRNSISSLDWTETGGPQPPHGRKIGVEPWPFPRTPLL